MDTREQHGLMLPRQAPNVWDLAHKQASRWACTPAHPTSQSAVYKNTPSYPVPTFQAARCIGWALPESGAGRQGVVGAGGSRH